MEIDLVIKYKGKKVDIDFSDCKNSFDCLDLIIETLGAEIDSDFNGYYQVNQVAY